MGQSDEEELLDLLMRWEELRRRGQPIVVADLCRNRPDLLDELLKRITALETTSWLEQPLEDEDPPEADSLPSSPRVPKIFAERYRLDSIIAEGGFAQVWKGTDLELRRVVAVKIPKPSRLDSADSFFIEAQRVARLKHDRIVPVFDVGRENGTCFIVSEYVEGGSLKSHLAKGPLPKERAIRWIAEIADALQYAHEQGIIHRDIKPANILIDHNDRAMLADFGIAQSPLKAAKSIGTIKYMSPEQLAGEPAAVPADIFSLGVVLHECLTGDLPYPSSRSPQLPATVEKGLPKCAAHRIPASIRAICEQALSIDPHQRPVTAAAFSHSLRRAFANTRITRWIPVAVFLGALVLSAIWGIRIAPRVKNALRPQLQAHTLPDWKKNNQDLFMTIDGIAKATQECKPTVKSFASAKSRYEQMGGGVVGPNGKVYCMPAYGGIILAIDPVSLTAASAATLPNNTGEYFGAVLAPDGFIYGIPHGATTFFRLNPENNEITTFGSAPGGGAYWGGVVANNGKIYCIPSCAENVLEIDPVNLHLKTFGTLSAGQYKYSGGVLAPNGKIYCMPDRATKVLVIDPENQSLSFIDEDLGEGATKAFGGVLAPNGKIYSGMGVMDRMLVIDPSNDSLTFITNLPQSKYLGSVLGPDGKIYSIPHRRNKVLVINPETHDVTYLPNSETEGGHWGAVLTPHGSIIGIPWEANDVLMIDFGVKVPENWSLSRFYNKF